MPSRWLAFDRIRALTRRHNIYQAERLFQDQSSLDRILAGGSLLNPNGQNSIILDQTNLQLNRLERYKDYEQMDQMGEISLALDLYADEASLVDAERKHTLIIRAHSRRLKRELEELFFGTLQWDNNCRSTIRYLCKFGDCPFEIVPDRNRTGVSAIKHINVYNFTRIETRYGDLVGFFYTDELQSQPIFMHPWQIMHLRLTSLENIYAPYGRAIIDGGRKAFKQLRLMEDAALIYRITRAPEKRKFTIPVGMIPPKETMEYMEMVARSFKRQRFYDPGTGNFNERYSPITQEDDFFLPRRPDGAGPDIEILPGGENVDKIADIEYFKKKMIAPTKIPFSRVGIGEGAGEEHGQSLSQTDSQFAKAVQWVQRENVTGLTKVGIIHLLLRGYTVEDVKGFELAMSATSAMEELYRMETWQTRTQVMLELRDLGWFPKEWIITHFTDLTPDEIEELKEMEAIATAGGDELGGDEQGGGGGGGGMGGLGGPEPGGIPGEEDVDLGGLDLDPEQQEEDQGEAAAESSHHNNGRRNGQLPGWDRRAQFTVLTELRLLKRQRKRDALRECIVKLARRLGRDNNSDTTRYNGYTMLVETNELDGLTRHNNGEAVVLYESNITESMRREARQECLKILVQPTTQSAPAEHEITESDLPRI